MEEYIELENYTSIISANVRLLNPWKSFTFQYMICNLQNNSTQYKEPMRFGANFPYLKLEDQAIQ